MRSVFTDPAHRLYVDDAPLPKPLPDECVVRVRASGICGSDCTSWRKGSIGGHDVKAPLRLGHESAGEIVAVGSSVRNLKLGDRVCIEPGIACGSCRQCRSGWYNLCPQVKFISVAPCHGTLAEYVAHPASWLHKLSPETDFREGALIEPMSIALASVRRADLKLGHSVAIIGAGSIGLMIYLLAKASGATPITLVDSSQARLDFAVSALGVRPSEVVRADPQGTHTAEAARIIESMSGTRPNIVFECTGFPGPVHVAIEALELGGVLTEVGIGANVDDLPFSDMLHRQIDLRFVMRANSCFEDCVKLLENGIVNPRPLVTHNYTLEEAPTAFAAASHPQAGAVKVHIVS
ncbi:GroES-like protein [Ceraceosorus guamensis]|uniref:L-arabinitol 4-dehydrogenase n=1 Tax=Ceraceosorus guamensis TaxID=1522189 RepID=A0A316VU77_9BASI|nr:GroES-like protein [Ceraceosorus guamensis]PWN39811.1 GroES-like protein [Ceraceosorus guamensis]